MAAYNICPNTPSNPLSGIVTRASAAGPGALVPYFAGAYQIFEAPPGASLGSVSFDVAAIRLATFWTTGIVTYDGDFNIGELPYGCYAGRPGCAIGTSAFFGPVTVPLRGHSRFRFETRCVNARGCDISSSGFNPGTRALFAAANLRVVVHDSTPPGIVPSSGDLWRDGWHRGVEHAWQLLTDNVGIMILRLYVDGALEEGQDYRMPDWPPGVRCDFTRARPCNDVTPGGVTLDTRTLPDGPHSIRVEAVDAAGNRSALERQILVDNAAPAHVSASVDGGDEWRRSNRFTIRWAPPLGELAPIAPAHYVLCSEGKPGQCEAGTREGAVSGELSDLRVPEAGQYTLRLWLEDAAGNSDPASASDPVRLRFDDSAPNARFELLDEKDPLLVKARVFDSESGLAVGSIEIRRAGLRQWHELPTTIEDSRLLTRIDDSALPDGTYQLRALVRDRAGNESVGHLREDGARMELALPLRAASRIAVTAAGGERECRSRSRRAKRRCHRRKGARTLVRGAGATVRGRVERADGRPIGGALIEVLELPRAGRAARRRGAVRSDDGGRFAYRSERGPTRTIRFSWAGTPLTRPAAAELMVLAPARTTISVSRTGVQNGQRVRFAGRLVGGPVPDGGKLIDLQARYRGRWRTFAIPRTDARGRWAFSYRFEATRGLVTYGFRARVRREAAYPYELGYSRVVKVTVRGP
jgi:hypothetical protein